MKLQALKDAVRFKCREVPRRIGDHTILKSEVAAWQRQRNASGACIKWKTTQKAREKLARAYSDIAKESKSL